jgi:hypothetical protein
VTHRIADTFYDALSKLTPQEQKAVKQSAFPMPAMPTSHARSKGSFRPISQLSTDMWNRARHE